MATSILGMLPDGDREMDMSILLIPLWDGEMATPFPS